MYNKKAILEHRIVTKHFSGKETCSWEREKSGLADWIQDQLVMPYGGLAPTWNAT